MLTIRLNQKHVEYIFNFTMYVVFNPNNGAEHPWMPVFEEQLGKLFEDPNYDQQRGYTLMLTQEQAMGMLGDLREETSQRMDELRHDTLNGFIQSTSKYRMDDLVLLSEMIWKLRQAL